ncbi:hypothetical protein PRZ48_001179 [Zasmidium cellare]|uniref:3'-5' exonuclease domain-containing protein n=1 Tax=Zasmidium cellare TaxID=395010 RepID=A0ABR0F0I9_ZASCE|nr:hypothetical protein PRZ48_001179 [Zasmidium cellare]
MAPTAGQGVTISIPTTDTTSTPRTVTLTTGFEKIPCTAEEDEASRLRAIDPNRFIKRDANSDLELLKDKVVAAKAMAYKIRGSVRHHVNDEAIKELGIDELFNIVSDIKARVDACDTSAPPRRVGPVDNVPEARLVVVDTVEQVEYMLERIIDTRDLNSQTPRIFINCVGDNLGRDGKMTLLTVYLPEASTVFLVDVMTFGPAVFQIHDDLEPDFTLQSMLEDASLVKACWDCRSNSDALFAHFSIKLAGVVEVQLLDLATKKSGLAEKEKPNKRKPRLPSLEDSFTNRLNVTEETKIQIYDIENWGVSGARDGTDQARRMCLKQCASERGEKVSYDDEEWIDRAVEKGLAEPAVYARPLQEPFTLCWAQKVLLLPALHKHFVEHSKYTEERAKEVAAETEKRLELSRSPEWKYEDPSMPPKSWSPEKKSGPAR